MINSLNFPALEDALQDVEFFERDRTDVFVVKLDTEIWSKTLGDGLEGLAGAV